MTGSHDIPEWNDKTSLYAFSWHIFVSRFSFSWKPKIFKIQFFVKTRSVDSSTSISWDQVQFCSRIWIPAFLLLNPHRFAYSSLKASQLPSILFALAVRHHVNPNVAENGIPSAHQFRVCIRKNHRRTEEAQRVSRSFGVKNSSAARKDSGASWTNSGAQKRRSGLDAFFPKFQGFVMRWTECDSNLNKSATAI